ncbi:hypothetical protein EV2_003860 [Malus domestica]
MEDLDWLLLHLSHHDDDEDDVSFCGLFTCPVLPCFGCCFHCTVAPLLGGLDVTVGELKTKEMEHGKGDRSCLVAERCTAVGYGRVPKQLEKMKGNWRRCERSLPQPDATPQAAQTSSPPPQSSGDSPNLSSQDTRAIWTREEVHFIRDVPSIFSVSYSVKVALLPQDWVVEENGHNSFLRFEISLIVWPDESSDSRVERSAIICEEVRPDRRLWLYVTEGG